MARNRVIPSLPELLAAISRRAAALPPPDLPDDTPDRFPVAVKAETRAFLKAQADALNTSVAAIGGTILDAVAAESLQLDGGAAAYRHIADRVFWLVREHGISLPAAADHLARIGLDGQALRSSADLERALNSDLIREVAKFFGASREWLAGLTQYPAPTTVRDWASAPARCAAGIALLKKSGATVRVIFIRSERAAFDMTIPDHPNGSERTGFIAVLCREYGHRDEPLRTYELMRGGRWSYDKSRISAKTFINLLDEYRVIMDGYEIPDADWRDLNSAKALPVSVLPRRACHYMPEDYARETENPGKEVEEWLEIKETPSYKRERRLFEQLIKGNLGDEF